MKTFITSRPETDPARFDSSFDPVLTGVAQGLARLFPPVGSVRPPRDGETGEPSTVRRSGGTGGEEGRS